VAGPGLPHAGPEVADLATIMPGARTLTGPEATATEVLAALSGAGVAHVAAHAAFRGDNPLFSTVRLVDGPVTVYDLERLAAPADLLVLSACEAGLSAVEPGEELLGPAAAILGLGTAALVAGVGPVSDAVTRGLMRTFHAHRSAGASPAAALAAAQYTPLGSDDPAVLATAAHFVCIGAG